MDQKHDKYEGDVGIKPQGNAFARIENFWYHYKWHTVAAAFMIFVILICSIQCSRVTRYDVQVLYAGNHAFARTSGDGSYSEYMKALSSVSTAARDYDENGEVKVTFLDLYILSPDEMSELENDPEAQDPPYQLLQENSAMLKNNLDMSDYYVCFLSERLFLQYSEGESNAGRFAKIAPYTKAGAGYDYVSEYGIRLSSIDFSEMPGISGVDAEDTVVCIRNVSAMSSVFGRETSEEHFRRSEELLREILAYQKEG